MSVLSLHRRRPALVTALLAVAASHAVAGDVPERGAPVLVLALAAAVDSPTAAARAAAADALAARADVSLEQWIEALRAFAPSRPRPESGAGLESADLAVLGGVETTSIATYVPRSLPASGPAGLLLAFHGQGGRGVEMSSAWASAAEASRMIVVAPTEAGPNDGYRFSARERAAALAAFSWARRRFDVDENRVCVTGWSRGGHLAWDVALRHADRFAGLVSVVGAPRLSHRSGENNLRYLENLVDTSVRDLQGSKDDPRALWNLRFAFARLDAWKARDARLVEFPDRGHDADLTAVDWVAFFAATRRDPHARRVVRRAAAPQEGRAGWAEILATDATVSEPVAPNEPAGWATMDETAKRTFIQTAIDQRTARLEVTWTGPNRFEAKSAGVARWRLLLDRELVDPSKPVTVVANGRPVTRAVAASKRVLLREFVERFDRTFLPIVEILLP